MSKSHRSGVGTLTLSNKTFFWTICLLVFLLPGTALSEMSKRVGGYKLVFNVIPSILFMDHPKTHPVRNMHGGVAGIPKYHLMLSIFDTKTGKRVKSAIVVAKVIYNSGQVNKKKLEAMLLNGVLNYGNYFSINNSDSVKVEFEIRIKEKKVPFKVVFHWSLT